MARRGEGGARARARASGAGGASPRARPGPRVSGKPRRAGPRDVPQGQGRAAEGERAGPVQQPERAAAARQAARLLRLRARRHRQPGERRGRRARRLAPAAAGQGGEPGRRRLGHHPGNAAWCVLPSRVLLVLTSRKGIQVRVSAGRLGGFPHPLMGVSLLPGQAVFARGIAASGQRFVCVGTSSGSVLVFDVPSKGTNITLSEVLEKHCSSITDEGGADLVTADDSGALCVWCAGDKFKLITRITPVSESTCSSVKLWNGVIVAGYGNGQIRLYEAASGTLRAEVNAHARWIYALDLAPHSGKVSPSCLEWLDRAGGWMLYPAGPCL
uniref:WD repeat domain 54 n=1 Tax=Varanus komodoensis TaxID=61221 RepID=A0A8D2Q4B0_VARKO